VCTFINNNITNYNSTPAEFRPAHNKNTNICNAERSNLLDFSYHTTPNVKLFYPEPFIATPTFIHEDLWFVHIAIYQYWLWFFFIFLIVFFFITFLITVRWCNVRYRPVRETRGVSRSKCGDLITATVPISWATSIIIHESTDAIEFSDGFGTTELAVGIRAYQWGWEYYYPKDLNLFKLNASNSTYEVGHSLKYLNESTSLLKNNSFFFNITNASKFNPTNSGLNLLINSLNFQTNKHLHNFGKFGINKLYAQNASKFIMTSKGTINKNLLKGVSLGHSTFLKNSSLVTKTPLSNSSSITLLNNKNQTNFIKPAAVFPNYFNINSSSNLNVLMSPEVNSIDSVWNRFNAYSTTIKSLVLKDLNSLNTTFTSKNLFRSRLTTSLTGATYWHNTNQVLFDKVSCGILDLFSKDSVSALNSTLSLNYTKYKGLFTTPTIIIPSTEFMLQLPTVFVDKLMYADRVLSYTPKLPSYLADSDFKRWDALSLMEDLGLRTDVSVTVSDYYRALESSSSYSFLNTALYLLQSPNKETYATPQNFQNVWTTPTFTKITGGGNLEFFKSNNLGAFSALKTLSLMGDTFSWNFVFQYTSDLKSLSVLELALFYNSAFVNINPVNRDYLGIGNQPTNSFKSTSGFNFLTYLKGILIFEQAILKIYKNNFEEGRPHFNFSNLSKTSVELPLITQKLISKTNQSVFNKKSNNFLSTELYKNKTNFSNVELTSLTNLEFVLSYQFPFSLSFDSDVIRYSWFDWFARRTVIITKSIDTSIFNLYGLRYYSNISEYSASNLSLLNKTDNFLAKYKHARSLLIPTNLYYPTMVGTWVLENGDSFYLRGGSVGATLANLRICSWDYKYSGNATIHKNLSFKSNFTTSSEKTHSLHRGDSFLLSKLHDILVKREYLLTYNLLGTKQVLDLQNTIDLYSDLYKTVYTLNSNLFSSTTIKKLFCKVITYTNFNFYENSLQLKCNMQPMRKGIVNMIRIQADKAIALPIDTRLQILAVSKDIIHSWSIPSAGIKIDCIPGYSSHKVVIFLLSGIYWGQCMEICGRFHHWMPIVVYFMKKDLFCLWCTHFIFNKYNTGLVNNYNFLNKSDSTLLVNHSPSTWSYNL